MAQHESTLSRWMGRHLRLVYLVFFVVPLFVQPPGSLWLWSVNGVALLVFLWLYARVQRATGLALASCIGGIFVLGAALLSSNPPGGVTFFIYAASFLDRVERPRVAGVWLLVLTAAAGAALWWYELVSMLGMPVIMLIVGGHRIHAGELQRKKGELSRSRDEIGQLAALAERERIGRDLHDLLGHTLSVIVLKSELAAKIAEADPERSVAEIRDVERISRETLADVRAAISGYRARGLTGELDNARRVLAGVRVAVSSAVDRVELSAVQEAALAVALREGVTNVVRHARASRCAIRLGRDGDRIRLEIEDDGVGGAPSGGNGLAGMRARISALGGAVEHDGRAGWLLAVSIPAGGVGSPVPPADAPAAPEASWSAC